MFELSDTRGEPVPHSQKDPDTQSPALFPGDDGKENAFFTAAVGASAGGLDALRQIFSQLPFDNMSFVVIQHLPAEHKSMLPEILDRVSTIRVEAAHDGQHLKTNHVYVAPPNVEMGMLNGRLRLWPMTKSRAPHHTIDFFMQALANDQGKRAIGVVLSGTGTDGTAGLQAIREVGGIALVQDPATAKFTGMPTSALRSGATDFCLGPNELAQELVKLGKLGRELRQKASLLHEGADLAKLLIYVRRDFDLDLREYKPAMLERRVERRMALKKLTDFSEYFEMLQKDRKEFSTLRDDMLIGVTSFFRDKEVYRYLEDKVLADVLKCSRAGEVIRFWSVGCSTGEEAYSLAIAAREAMKATGIIRRVQIFATDLDEKAIESARKGSFPVSAEANIPRKVLDEYFENRETSLRLNRDVRDMIIFSRHNILSDPPFSKMHFISCRNLLIYFQPTAQRQVLSTFHYALREGGTLLLGESETVGDAPDLFTFVDSVGKIYRRRETDAAGKAAIQSKTGILSNQRFDRILPPRQSIREIANGRILDAFGSPYVIVDSDYNLLETRGDTSRYLSFPAGSASLNIMRLAPGSIHEMLRQGLSRASKTEEMVTLIGSCRLRSSLRNLQLRVFQLKSSPSSNSVYLILFNDSPLTRKESQQGAPNEADQPESGPNKHIQALERELDYTKTALDQAEADKEKSLEEVKTFAEEMQSSNEELQSTNEQLETSQEEMQSSNEELTVVNEELQSRINALGHANEELSCLLDGIDAPAIIIGSDARLRRYGSAAEVMFDISASDVGRSVDYLRRFFSNENFQLHISQAHKQECRVVQPVQHVDGSLYDLNIFPLASGHQAAGGCVLLFARKAQNCANNQARYLAAARKKASRNWDRSPIPMFLVMRDMVAVWANDSFYDRFAVNSESLRGRRLDTPQLIDALGLGIIEQVRRVLNAYEKSPDLPPPLGVYHVASKQLVIDQVYKKKSGLTPLLRVSIRELQGE